MYIYIYIYIYVYVYIHVYPQLLYFRISRHIYKKRRYIYEKRSIKEACVCDNRPTKETLYP